MQDVKLLEFSKKKGKNNAVIYIGRATYNGLDFSIHMTEQRSGSYLIRGKISVLSPIDGKVLQHQGAKRAKIVGQLIAKGKCPDSKILEQHHLRELNVSTSIYMNTLNETEIKQAVCDSVIKLYHNNAQLCARVLQKSNRPGEITPAVAVAAYYAEFLPVKYPALKDRSKANYTAQAKKLCAYLPNSPMTEIRSSSVEAAFAKCNASKNTKKRFYEFWQFLLDNGYVLGNNPVAREKKKKPSVNTLQSKSSNPDVLSLEDQDALYHELIAGTVSGADCGIALACWGGVNWNDAITWKDIYFDANDESLVVLNIKKDDLAGATHDYSRPIMPFGALILRRRFDELRLKYTLEDLSNALVISQKTDPLKPLSNDNFTKEATRVLLRIGFPKEVFRRRGRKDRTAAAKRILGNTYKNNVHTRMGLADDAGTKQFLCGERLGDVTSDNYTHFNDPDGIERLHAAAVILAPLELRKDPQLVQETLPDGRIKYTIYPKDSRRQAKVSGTFLLPPGAEFEVHCSHGAEISVSNREMNSDGTVKRKRPRKKA